MTAIVYVLLFVIVVFFGVMLWQDKRITLLLKARDINHAKCISHVAHYTGNQFAANVLKAAAEDYASPDGQHEIATIIQSGEYSDRTPIPVIWMERRAEALIAEVQP